ncbi:MAG: acylglycerol kinase family protein, partial [Leptospiraceae bacterium]|nr:acylglycerol kinase family protein [Leptospiraceae bacterium]
MPEVVLIYNPGSGKKKGGKRAIDFMERWIERFGTEPVLRPTQSKEDIRLAVKETYQSGIIQIFMGGDGTISECLQGLSELKSFSKLEEPVGILPAGSGNSFLRDFALKNYEEARDALLDAIANTSVRKVDMGFIQY